ncbi:hypothetical protein ADUPG1_005537, partial [Aduncisulcus paluster]
MKEMLAMRDEVLHHSKDFGIVLRESGGKRRFQPQESFRRTGTDRFKRHASAGASKEIRCFKCGRVGHKAYECKYTKRSDKPQSVKAKMAGVSSKAPVEYMMFLTPDGYEEPIKVMLDSGAEH